ncbi:MAG: PEP-CTERM sorting domain-containing protein [bacterium]
MKKILITLIGLAALSLAGVQGQVTINSVSFTYTQNFDTLAASGTNNTWTDNATLAGWYANRTAYISTNGSSTTGALNSLGAASSSDRALGATTSGTTTTVNFGMVLRNACGFSINLSDISLSYTGEMWRINTNIQSLAFEYQVSSSAITSITSGTYTANTNLNFTSPGNGTAAAVDGSSPAYRTSFSNVALTPSGVLNDGDYLAIRWTKNGTNSPALGIDDLTISANAAAVPEPTTWALIGLGSAFVLWRVRRQPVC